uniref:UDP-glucuronosyltransferase n=1 Tax=Plectus sambesii TaxID=2011161 RepID=A0A914UM94_9BILA
HSHVSFNGKLADLLTKAGHEVVLLLADIDPLVATNGSRHATVMRVSMDLDRTRASSTMWTNPGPFEDSRILTRNITLKLWKVGKIMIDACEALANNDELLRTLRQYKFDIGMLEQYDSCAFGLLQALNIETRVWLSATAVWRMQPFALGVEYPSSFVPELFAPFSDEMSFFDRLINFGVGQVTQLIYLYHSQATETEIFRRVKGRNFPDLLALSAGSQLSLINSMSVLDFPAPQSSNMLYSGGFTIDKNRRYLTEEWKSIADNSKKGLVLMSFGAIAKTIDMPDEMQSIIFRVFARFPDYTFVVKFENISTTERVASNVYLTSWIPQVELMHHHKYRALIAQAGWSSILEALHNGSPMVLMPLFADHFKNAKVVEKRKVGIIIDKLRFTMEKFSDALRAVLEDPAYTINAKRYSKMLHDTPMPVEQLLVHQVGYAERHNRDIGRHALVGLRLRFDQYRLADLFAMLLFSGLALGFLLS